MIMSAALAIVISISVIRVIKDNCQPTSGAERAIWGIGGAFVLLIFFLIAEFTLSPTMNQWPGALFGICAIAILLAAANNARWAVMSIVAGYLLGFVIMVISRQTLGNNQYNDLNIWIFSFSLFGIYGWIWDAATALSQRQPEMLELRG